MLSSLRENQALRICIVLALLLGLSAPLIADEPQLLSTLPSTTATLIDNPVIDSSISVQPAMYVVNRPQPTELLSTSEQLEQLTQRLQDVEFQLAKQTAATQEKAAADQAAKAKEQEELEKKWTVKLGGHAQLDYINWAQADPAITGPAAEPGTKDYFEFRRLRLVADGTGYEYYDFRLQLTLEPEAVSEINDASFEPAVKDVYFSINELPILGRFRIGNFFVPFSLEQVTNDTHNVFMERSIPTQGVFAADREVGMAVYQQSENQRWTLSSGVFLDSISESIKRRIDDNQGVRLSSRLTWLPYYDEASQGRYLVHTGVGVLYTQDQDHNVRFRARPQVRQGPRLIDSGSIAADEYTTGNLELAVVWGAMTIQSEAFISNVSAISGDDTMANGAYLHLSYFLTGEHRIYEKFGQHGPQFGRPRPYQNVWATTTERSWGAWEAKTRWSYLNLDQFNRGQNNDLTVGFNWYWSDRVRVMFDWIHPVTSSQTTFGETESDLLAMRFDFNW